MLLVCWGYGEWCVVKWAKTQRLGLDASQPDTTSHLTYGKEAEKCSHQNKLSLQGEFAETFPSLFSYFFLLPLLTHTFDWCDEETRMKKGNGSRTDPDKKLQCQVWWWKMSGGEKINSSKPCRDCRPRNWVSEHQQSLAKNMENPASSIKFHRNSEFHSNIAHICIHIFCRARYEIHILIHSGQCRTILCEKFLTWKNTHKQSDSVGGEEEKRNMREYLSFSFSFFMCPWMCHK